MSVPVKPIFSYKRYRDDLKTVSFFPTTKKEMEQLGWDECDVIIISGDAYIDHPSFGSAIIARVLESQGFRVGIIAQPNWHSTDDFKKLGRPRLYFGVAAGNMDSMVNHYTADRKIRSDDAYTPGGVAGRRPDRATLIYTQRAKQAYSGVPVLIGSIEASLRRLAHYDYWSDTVRRSILPDSKADILLYGNAERAIIEVTHRVANGEKLSEIRDVRGTAFLVPKGYLPNENWLEIDSQTIEKSKKPFVKQNPYFPEQTCTEQNKSQSQQKVALHLSKNAQSVIRLPSFEAVKDDLILFAHATRVMHLETNPYNAGALSQTHANRDVWVNPPPIPLTMQEMDRVYGLPFARAPHPSYEGYDIPAWEMIRFSVNIMRGCFGGCSFCSITMHEGRIIQNRSEPSILKEIETIRDKMTGFTGMISDLGGPTANMYRLGCKNEKAQQLCRRFSCLYPNICPQLLTDHSHLIRLYRRARALPGIRRIVIGSGVRYDLAISSPEYIKELVTHHVGGLLKIAPEHTEQNVLDKMLKPSIASYDVFSRFFAQYSNEANKVQYLVPYFIAAHPGTTDEDMLALALWLKKNRFKPDQVQTFMPTPMSLATAMYHTGLNPLEPQNNTFAPIETARQARVRRLHKAFLRYHDPDNWMILREWLRTHGYGHLIGTRPEHLVPPWKSSPKSIKHLVNKGKSVEQGTKRKKDVRPKKNTPSGFKRGR